MYINPLNWTLFCLGLLIVAAASSFDPLTMFGAFVASLHVSLTPRPTGENAASVIRIINKGCEVLSKSRHRVLGIRWGLRDKGEQS